jgi:hypothetical protein
MTTAEKIKFAALKRKIAAGIEDLDQGRFKTYSDSNSCSWRKKSGDLEDSGSKQQGLNEKNDLRPRRVRRLRTLSGA